MGKSLEELEIIPTTDKLYMEVIEGNIYQIGERMKSMNIGERNVEVTKYPTKSDAQVLHNEMRDYEPEYNKSLREKRKQSNMKRFDWMLRCLKHTKISDYSLEFNLCGEICCDLCPIIPCVLQMYDEELTKEVLSFCPLPQLDVYGKKFLPINEWHRLTDHGSSLSDDLKDLENLRGEFKDNDDELAERKKYMER